MRIKSALLVGTCSLAGLLVAASAHAVIVATCGQEVRAKGELAGDLDCTAQPGAAVVLHDHAKLDLRGFTMYGGEEYAVECEGKCSVRSSVPGGTVTGSQGWGIAADNGSIRVLDVTVTNNVGGGITAYGGGTKAKILRCVVTGNGQGGGLQFQNRKTMVADSTITDNAGCGMNIRRFVLRNTTISGNECGVNGNVGPGRIDASTITNNDDNGAWVSGDNGPCGLRITASTITGNATGPCSQPGSIGACGDIVSCSLPVLVNSTCDTSAKLPPGSGDWDICTLD